jgi:tetratricopeptide (TPR) repeat protein
MRRSHPRLHRSEAPRITEAGLPRPIDAEQRTRACRAMMTPTRQATRVLIIQGPPMRIRVPVVLLLFALALSTWPVLHGAAPLSAGEASSPGAVSIREETVVIPTYPTGEPLKAPMFFAGRTYQGAKGPMYPYVLVDRLSDRLEDRTYTVVWLENAFVRIGILPELGGRIWVGQDKTNGYDFFYRNTVVKPALIGMVGAWISGGVEWNIPHHHRASSFMPVDYRAESHADGSRTVWVGEVEYRHRMRWAVGITLHPDRSTVDATVRLVNRSPVAHSFLYFANVAVHANDDYQVIFPPGTEYGTQHAKMEFIRWPVADGTYAGVDFTGVDVSWWKNHPTPISIFAWNDDDSFLAGYDHGRQVGTMHVADPHTVPGKKFFEWGPGDEGRFWDGILTDTDGPYLELMVGGYSDNQPDYSWIGPSETKTLTETWYPIRDLGGVVEGTREAAMNLAPHGDGAVRLAFNTTAAHAGAQVRLARAGDVLHEETIAIGPAQPYARVLPVPAGVGITELRGSLHAGDGRELVAYQPKPPKGDPVPRAVVPPPPPSEVKTNDELYRAGLRIEQFYSPAAEPEPYYEEAIRRDPGDARARTAMGVLLLKRGEYDAALGHLDAAVARAGYNHTRARETDPYYYRGLALAALGRDREAEAAFGRATWDARWHAAGYTRLAEIAARGGDWDEAARHADEALQRDARNTRALALLAVAHRQRGDHKASLAAAERALDADPLDAWAEIEATRARSALGQPAVRAIPRGSEVETRLEIASDYAGLGLHADVFAVLEPLWTGASDPSRVNAMVFYVAADAAERLGRGDDAARLAARARQASSDYVFPFRLDHIPVLRRAMARDPQDARAPYYLGNLLMDVQPEAALEAWRTAAGLDPSFAMVHRNLGWVAARRQGGTADAIAQYERAVNADAREPVFFYELDKLYEVANTPPAARLATLDRHRVTVALRDDATARRVRLLVQLGRYDEALSTLRARRFSTWEGGTRFLVHDEYVDALLRRGHQRVRAGQYARALEDYRAALEYPPNLGVGRPARGGRAAQVQYFIGEASHALGRSAQAREAWQRSTAAYHERFRTRRPAVGDWAAIHYYQALAFKRLGDEAQAREIFDGLIANGQRQLEAGSEVDFFAKFGEQQSEGARRAHAHYLVGLGHLGHGRAQEARAAFEQAVALDVNHLGAATELAR